MRHAILLVFLIGCARDVRARYPAAPDAPTGTLVLLLSQPTSHVSVAVNGRLVVEDAHTRKLTIEGVPVGTSEVTLAASGADKQLRVWVDETYPTTVPLGVPEASSPIWKTLLGTLISITAYALLR